MYFVAANTDKAHLTQEMGFANVLTSAFGEPILFN